jgi:glycosyltransferase involved in cell wall biosynthesis
MANTITHIAFVILVVSSVIQVLTYGAKSKDEDLKLCDTRFQAIYGFHHNQLDRFIGAGVRTEHILVGMGRRLELPVTLCALDTVKYEKTGKGLREIGIRKPLMLRMVKSAFLCMFPQAISFSLRTQVRPMLATPAIVIFEGPFFGYALIKSHALPKDCLKIYNAHNLEADYWKPYFNKPMTRWLLKRIKTIERTVANEADFVLVTSVEEAKAFEKKYHVPHEKIIIVPNGVDLDKLEPIDDTERAIKKRELFGKYDKIAVFMGSDVKANTEAARWIVRSLAPQFSNVCFLIIGSACKAMTDVPKNVRLLGVLSEAEKDEVLAIADIALNPVMMGAGTNVKMLEYMAAGLAIVTTPVGARGLSIEDRKEAIISERGDFNANLDRLLANSDLQSEICRNSRAKAEQFDWSKIIDNTVQKISGSQKRMLSHPKIALDPNIQEGRMKED